MLIPTSKFFEPPQPFSETQLKFLDSCRTPGWVSQVGNLSAFFVKAFRGTISAGKKSRDRWVMKGYT